MVVLVTGAAGQIGYAITFMIAGGKMLGPSQKIELRLLDIPPMQKVLDGVVAELEDCAFPLVTKVVGTTDYKTAFEGVEIAMLIGARPRSPGMERKDLLQANATIFQGQGKALNDYASKNVKVLVVGNPANTNCYIAMKNAPTLPPTAFSAMTRLDQNRGVGQIAKRLNVQVRQVQNIIVWGNHSTTQYPDVNHASVYDEKNNPTPVREVVGDDLWLNGEFIKTIQQRGGYILNLLGKSSAASAANAAVDHVRDWVLGTRPGHIVSMAVPSDGSYGVPEGLVFSFPVTCKDGGYTIVRDLVLDDFSQEKLRITKEELLNEKKDAGF